MGLMDWDEALLDYVVGDFYFLLELGLEMF